MLNATKLAVAMLGAAFVATVPASALAAQSYVAPKKAALKINQIRCPGNANVKFSVWSRKSGPVKVQLERRGDGILGSDIIRADTKKSRSYKGTYSGTVGLTRSRSLEMYRIIATGNGQVRKSKWVVLRSCALVM